MRSVWLLFAILALGPLAGTARAAPRDPMAAEALFRAGREALEKGEYEAALRRFDEAYRLDPTAGALLNRALAKEALGQLARAWLDYRQVLERLEPSDPRVEITRQKMSALEGRLAWLTVELEPGAPSGTTVTRNDVELGSATLGLPLPFDPGRHELVVAAPGFQKRPYVVELEEGERRVLAVAPEPEAASSAGSPLRAAIPPSSPLARELVPAPAPAAPPAVERGAPTSSYVLLGVGAAGLAVAAVSGVFLLDRLSTVDDNCENKQCNEAGLEAGRSGRTFRAVAAISLGVGVVSAGVGGYLLLSSRGDATEVAWRGSF